jgi:hypothetical protein
MQQTSSDVPIVDISGMMARLGLAQGPVTIQAPMQGRYNLDRQQVAVSGPVRVSGPDGERLATRDVLVDLKSRQVRSTGISGRMPVGLHAMRARASGAERRRAASSRPTRGGWRAQPRRGARWRRSLENRARGGQMSHDAPIRSLLSRRAATAALAALAQTQGGPVSALKGHNSNAPIDVAADRIEVQDRADRAIFAGNVKVRQAS